MLITDIKEDIRKMYRKIDKPEKMRNKLNQRMVKGKRGEGGRVKRGEDKKRGVDGNRLEDWRVEGRMVKARRIEVRRVVIGG